MDSAVPLDSTPFPFYYQPMAPMFSGVQPEAGTECIQ